jgi:hypothetical protein
MTTARPALVTWVVRLPPTSSPGPFWTRWSPLCKFEPRHHPCPFLLRLGTPPIGSPAVDPAASDSIGMIPNYVLSFFLFSSRCPWQVIAIDIFLFSELLPLFPCRCDWYRDKKRPHAVVILLEGLLGFGYNYSSQSLFLYHHCVRST